MSKSTADLFPVTERKPARRAAPKWHPKRSHGFAAALAVIVEAGRQSVGAKFLPPITLTGSEAPRRGTAEAAKPVLTVRALGAPVSTAKCSGTVPLLTVEETCATARCPRCGIEGGVDRLFGYRQVDGKRRAQSWCRDCRRAQRGASKSRLVDEAEDFARRTVKAAVDELPLW